jgi:hypothetical protein
MQRREIKPLLIALQKFHISLWLNLQNFILTYKAINSF